MTPTSDPLRIASRGSRLALKQAGIIAKLLGSRNPGLDIEIVTVRTKGDRDTRAFRAIGGKGLFTSEVEREVIEGRADVAVHSAKDLTAELADGCSIICIPPRMSVHDVVVGGEGGTGEQRLESLGSGERVGTSSVRRRALLAEIRPDVEVVDLRGNLDTRLRKVAEAEVEAAVVAAAGIERLSPEGGPESGALDASRWVPPPGQGALAVEALAERSDLEGLFEGLTDAAAAAEVACERAFATRLEGGCSVPLGCLARAGGGRLVVSGFLALPDASESVRDRISGGVHEPEALGAELAEAMLAAGGEDIIADLRELDGVEPSAP